MVHVVIAVVVIGMAGCRYSDPDYADTMFMCDTDHLCPADQQCVNGRCSRGGNGDGVACDTATCAVTDQCCVDFINPPRCITLAETCPGPAASCDGEEDCAGSCCDDGDGPACRAGACDGDNPTCLTADDCPGDAPNCCVIDPMMPWKTCLLQCI